MGWRRCCDAPCRRLDRVWPTATRTVRGRLLAVLIWAVPPPCSGHYRYALIACDHERLEFRCNAIAAVVALVLGVVLIPIYGASRRPWFWSPRRSWFWCWRTGPVQRGVVVPPLALGLPSLVRGCRRRARRCGSSRVSAAGWPRARRPLCYLSLLLLYESRRWFGLRVDRSPGRARSLGTVGAGARQ